MNIKNWQAIARNIVIRLGKRNKMIKALTREEMVKWIEESNLPLKLGATQLTTNIIVLRRIDESNKSLTLQDEILLKKLLHEWYIRRNNNP